jgi:hypothetical protein
MDIEMQDENTDDDDVSFIEHRALTPTRVLQIKFIGFTNALFNYIRWLIDQDNERRRERP